MPGAGSLAGEHRERVMRPDMDDRRRSGLLVAEALDAVQGSRAKASAAAMLSDLRHCVDKLAEHVARYADPAQHALNLLESRLARLEAQPPEDRRGHDIARLELTQRIMQLGQLLFITPIR